MIAKITIYDGDKEILTTEQKVREIPTLSDEGYPYTDCYVRLHFSIAEGGSNDVQRKEKIS